MDQLLKLIQEITDKQSDTDVLETAAKTLEVLCNEDFAIYSRCDISRCSLLDSIVNKYKEAHDEYTSLIEGVSPDGSKSIDLNVFLFEGRRTGRR